MLAERGWRGGMCACADSSSAPAVACRSVLVMATVTSRQQPPSPIVAAVLYLLRWQGKAWCQAAPTDPRRRARVRRTQGPAPYVLEDTRRNEVEGRARMRGCAESSLASRRACDGCHRMSSRSAPSLLDFSCVVSLLNDPLLAPPLLFDKMSFLSSHPLGAPWGSHRPRLHGSRTVSIRGRAGKGGVPQHRTAL